MFNGSSSFWPLLFNAGVHLPYPGGYTFSGASKVLNPDAPVHVWIIKTYVKGEKWPHFHKGNGCRHINITYMDPVGNDEVFICQKEMVSVCVGIGGGRCDKFSFLFPFFQDWFKPDGGVVFHRVMWHVDTTIHQHNPALQMLTTKTTAEI